MESRLINQLISQNRQNGFGPKFMKHAFGHPGRGHGPGGVGLGMGLGRNHRLGSDQLSLSPVTTNSAQQVVNQQVLDALNARLQEAGAAPIESLNPEEYGPQQVADRIVNFVNTAVAQANELDPTGELAAQKLEQARAGIDQGFAEAREILEGLGALEGQVAEDIDNTYQLIQSGLNGETPTLPGDVEEPTVPSAPITNSLSYLSRSYERSESTEVSIQTVDGDTVNIRILESDSRSLEKFSIQSGDTTVNSLTASRSSSREFEFVVEGELDEGERQAINDLLGKIDRIADKFFKGDVEKAFAKAAKLGFDTEELANFSLDLSYSEERAVTAYQSNSIIGLPQPTEPPPAIEPPPVDEGVPVEGSGGAVTADDVAAIEEAAEFVSDVNEVAQDETANVLFQNPAQAISDLISEFVAVRDESGLTDAVEQLRQSVREFIQQLLANLQAQASGTEPVDEAPAEEEAQAPEEANNEVVAEDPVSVDEENNPSQQAA